MKIINLIICVLTSLSLFAQTSGIEVTGIVTDKSTNEGLPGATVISNKQEGTSTDINGQFHLLLKKTSQPLTLKISYIGYVDTLIVLSSKKNKQDIGIIPINQNQITLKQVTIKGKIPLAKQKGDTLSFNANAVKVKETAKGINLVKKLPGFTLKENTIETQGEQVQKVYVNGKPFFENDPKKALSVLPAEIIKNIELFDDYGEIASFTGYASGNSVKAINIVTKNQNGTQVHGELRTGYGSQNRYFAEGSLMINKGLHELTIISDNNNLNYSRSDLSDFKSMESQLASKMGLSFVDEQTTPGIQENNSISINHNYIKNNKFSINTDYTFGLQTNDQISEIEQNYQDTWINTTQDTSATKTHLHKLCTRLNWETKNSKWIIDQKVMLSSGNLDQSFNRYGTNYSSLSNNLINNTEASSSNARTETSAIWLHNINDQGRSLTMIARYVNQQSNSNKSLKAENYKNIIIDDITLHGKTVFESNDETDLAENDALLRVSFKEPINMLNNLNFVVSSYWSWNNGLKNCSSEQLYPGSYLNFSTFKTQKSGHKLEMGYSKFDLKYIFNIGLAGEVLNYKHQNDLLQDQNGIKKMYSILPIVYGKYFISSKQNLLFFMRASSFTPRTLQVQPFVSMTDPGIAMVGNPDLNPGLQYFGVLKYTLTLGEQAKYLSAYAYAKRIDNFIGMNNFILDEQVSIYNTTLATGTNIFKPLNLGTMYNLMGGTDFSMPLPYLSTNLNLGLKYTYNHIPTVFDNIEILTKSHIGSLITSFSSNISEKVDFFLSNTVSYNNASNSETSSITQYISNISSLDLFMDVYGWFGVELDFENHFYGYYGKNEDINFTLLNLSLSKNIFKNKRGNLELHAHDILNQGRMVRFKLHETYTENILSNNIEPHIRFAFTYKF